MKRFEGIKPFEKVLLKNDEYYLLFDKKINQAITIYKVTFRDEDYIFYDHDNLISFTWQLYHLVEYVWDVNVREIYKNTRNKLEQELDELGWITAVNKGIIYFLKESHSYNFDYSISGKTFDIDFPTLGTISKREFELMLKYIDKLERYISE